MINGIFSSLSEQLALAFPKGGWLELHLPPALLITPKGLRSALLWLRKEVPEDGQFFGHLVQANTDEIAIRFLSKTVPADSIKIIKWDGSGDECLMSNRALSTSNA